MVHLIFRKSSKCRRKLALSNRDWAPAQDNHIQELELRQEAKKCRGTSWPCWGSIRKAKAQLQLKSMKNKGNKKPLYLYINGRIKHRRQRPLAQWAGGFVTADRFKVKCSTPSLCISPQLHLSGLFLERGFKIYFHNSENWSSLESVSEILDPYVLPSTREINWGKSWLQRHPSPGAHMPCEQKLKKWGFSGKIW